MIVWSCALLLLVSTSEARTWSDQDLRAAQSWQVMESWIQHWIKDRSSSLRSILEGTPTVSHKCRRHLSTTLDALDNMQDWAVRMLDAWAKVPPGYSSGVSGFNGDFDACVSVTQTQHEFRGMYCNIRAKQVLPDFGKVHLWSVVSKFPEFAEMAFKNNTIMHNMVRDWIIWYYRYPYKIGICVPSTCSADDLVSLASEAFKSLNWNITVDDCQIDEDMEFTLVQAFTLSCILILVVLIAVATYVHQTRTETDSEQGWACHFSFVRNWKILTRSPPKENKFNFLDGMRVFLTYWTILMHTGSMYEPTLLSGCYTTVHMVGNPFLQIIMNGWASVDSFFCITGFLLGYSLLRNLHLNNGPRSWLKFVFRRICRLSPTLWALLGLVYLTPLVGSGSHWPEVFQRDVDRCHQSWLPVVLFINNWFRYDQMCLPMTWYLSVDVQLYILGTVLIYVLHRWPSAGLKSCLLAVVLPSVWLGYVVYVNDLLPSLIWETFDLEFREEMLRLTYLGSSAHLPSYIIGALTAYLLLKYPTVSIRKGTLLVFWTASLSTYVLIILSGHPWHNAQWPSPIVAALYQATHKIFWSLATAWIIFACATGNGGLFDKVFSWSGFAPLSKLSFLMGLLNIPIIRFKNSLLRRYISLTVVDLFYDFMGHYVVCVTLSVVLFLVVESPFASLTESYLKDGKKLKQR